MGLSLHKGRVGPEAAALISDSIPHPDFSQMPPAVQPSGVLQLPSY